MGLPGKPKGIDGGEVERHFREGKIEEIADYCETDAVGTYQVWLRYELFRGTLHNTSNFRHLTFEFIAERFEAVSEWAGPRIGTWASPLTASMTKEETKHASGQTQED